MSWLDIVWGPQRIISATVVLAPFVMMLIGSPRQTLLVGAVAVAACALSGSWNHNFGDPDYFVRLAIVIVGAAVALSGSRSRRRLAIDRQRFELLAGAAVIGDSTSSVPDTVDRLGALLVPALADICVIDVNHDQGVRRLAVVADGERGDEIARRFEARLTEGEDHRQADALTALQGDRARLTEHVDEQLLHDAAHDGEDLRFLASLEIQSSIVVALRAGGRRLGTLTLLACRQPGRRYDADDLAFVQVLCGRVALALDNAGLFADLESLEAQQTAALGNLAEAVTVQNTRGELVYANDAAARALGLSSARQLLETPPQEIVDAYESFTEDDQPLRLDQLPGRRALAGQQPEPLLIRVVHRASGEQRWRLVKATAVFDDDGRPRLAINIIEDVTGAKRAELAQRFLSQAGAVLASSLNYTDILDQVAHLAVPQLADWCSVAMPDQHGVIRTVALAQADAEADHVQLAREHIRRFVPRLGDTSASAQVMHDGQAQMINDVTDDILARWASDERQLQGLKELGLEAVILVPMVASGQAIGVISLVSSQSGRRFTQDELELAVELGLRAGTAVDNARLHTERSEIAQTLQASLLPDELPDISGLALASLYRPAGDHNVVGGDFYDAFATPEGWMLLVGDVTGRGAPAAALTAQARHTLRAVGALTGDPALAIAQLNRWLAASEQELAICTVASVLIRATATGSTASIICAGHPPPILIRDGQAHPVGICGPLVGAWPDSRWETFETTLHVGDVLVLFTDGVLDACRGPERFGERRLLEALSDARVAHDAIFRVTQALQHFEQGPQADDTALVAIEVTGTIETPDTDGEPGHGAMIS